MGFTFMYINISLFSVVCLFVYVRGFVFVIMYVLPYHQKEYYGEKKIEGHQEAGF